MPLNAESRPSGLGMRPPGRRGNGMERMVISERTAMSKPYTVELYGCDDNNFAHLELDDAEFSTVVRVAVALNTKSGSCRPVMHVYKGHVEPSFFGNGGAFEEIV